MTRRDIVAERNAEFRRRAEALAAEQAARELEDIGPLSKEESRRILHELRVHQLQLEMQNEELRRIQLDLEAAKADYFDLYDLAPVGYCTLGEAGLLLRANLTASTLLGKARSELLQHPFTQFIAPAWQDDYYRHRKALLETGERQVFDLRLLKAGGAEFWARLVLSLSGDHGAGRELRLVLDDISGLKEGELALQQSEERATKIFRAIPEGIVISRIADGMVVEVNDSFCRLSGWAREELLGRTVLDLNLWAELPQRDAYLERLRREGRVQGLEATFRTKTAELRTISLSAELLVQGDDRLVMALARDITDHQRAERELRRQAEELRVRNDELNRFNRVAVGRELRMVELKLEVNELCAQMGQAPRHALSEPRLTVKGAI